MYQNTPKSGIKPDFGVLLFYNKVTFGKKGEMENGGKEFA